uniref:NADH-ubiquinone oxidoreductase chain 2 n=1 Tax=Palaemon annandalei TaxID=392226 RepID=A0A344KVL2_9EUCA|nr:NADH dehydrogenase subunit 2 [Palaemon annandalei]AXB37211.1 NADH dehydrogenase subunit 2 [Palaemon annandalei]
MLLLSPSTLMFSSTLMAGTLISISSSSWLMAWLGLELNLLSFIPLITLKHNTFSSEAALKYFLIQALGSATFLASVTMLLVFTYTPKVLIFCSLILKMGAAPLHFWLPTIMQGMSWPNCIILMTIQKIAPLVLTSYLLCPQISALLTSASIFSAMMGGLGGLNQTLLRKLMAFSSINHMAWMLAAISASTSLWTHYILTYSVISASLVALFNRNQTFHIKHLTNFSAPQLSKITTFLSLFSLGGLPPFLGFLPKMMVIKHLVNQGLLSWAFILTMSALITLFYYIRVALTSMTLMTPKTSQDMNFTNHSSAKITLINLLPIFFPLMMLIPL